MVAPPPDEANSELAHDISLDFAASEDEDFAVTIRPRPGTRVVRLDSPAARGLRDLHGTEFDLRRVVELCRQYVETLDLGQSGIILDALWMSAVVLYGRCFNKGVRQSLDLGVLEKISGEARAAHDHFIDLRNKFVAHSVNAYEQTLPYAVVEISDSAIRSTGTRHFWANPFSREAAKTLEQLAWAFYNDGAQARALLGIMVRQETEALSEEALARLPDLSIETPSVDNGRRARKQ